MEKSFLVSYITYHQWANSIMLNAILKLTEEELHRPIPGSFPGVYATLLHLWWAEVVWWKRVSGDRFPEGEDPFHRSAKELGTAMLAISEKWKKWVDGLSAEELRANLDYTNSKGHFVQPIDEIIFHLFQHGTYHRGQLVTLLRQLGKNDIPTTDFIAWVRLNKPGPVSFSKN